jgi:hypothetical protein
MGKVHSGLLKLGGHISQVSPKQAHGPSRQFEAVAFGARTNSPRKSLSRESPGPDLARFCDNQIIPNNRRVGGTNSEVVIAFSVIPTLAKLPVISLSTKARAVAIP